MRYSQFEKNKKNDLPVRFQIADIYESALTNWHYDTEFILFTGGHGTVRCGTNVYNPTPGDIIVVNSGTIHVVDPLPGKTVQFQFLIIDRGFCSKYGINTDKIKFKEKISSENSKKLFLDFSNSFVEYNGNRNMTSLAKCTRNLLSFLIEICDNHIDSVQFSSDERYSSVDYVKKAIEYIHENLNKYINLDILASNVGISKFHLSREFKKYTGSTIISYINNLRCREAEGYIISGMSMEKAAFLSGFNSVQHFSKIFKKNTGLSPTSFKKANEK